MSKEDQPRPKRLAPPSLFVPPSRNVSTTDLRTEQQAQTPSTPRVQLLRQRSTFNQEQGRPSLDGSEASTAASPRQANFNEQQKEQRRPRKASTTEQTWADLQNTLEEVELSAASGTNVFGADHSHALEELRNAQIELARAWARGEEGEAQGDEAAEENLDPSHGSGHEGMRETSAVLASDRSERIGSGSGQGAGKDTGTGSRFGTKKSQLEEETENDILLARKRRQANDKYFERVNKGVVDVVAKLEGVAQKMANVETESQDIWGDKDSLDSRMT